MYTYILETKSETLVVAILISFFACLILRKPKLWLRTILYSYGPALACAFFVIANFYNEKINRLDLLAGFMLEFSILIASTKLFFDTFKRVRFTINQNNEKWLKWCIALQIITASPILLNEGAGIFSEGSRINYLHESNIARFLAYSGVAASYIQATLMAQRLNNGLSLGFIGYASLTTSFLASILSGSKGSFFLWLLSVVALIDYKTARISKLTISISIFLCTAALWTTAYYISEALGVTELEFAEISISRFFLNNDARALSIEYGGKSVPFSDLFAASFRVLANITGNPSSDPPLGLLLDKLRTGLDTGNGPNASLIALFIYYSTSGYALIPATLACIGVFFIYMCAVKFRKYLRSDLTKMATTVVGISLIQIYSQDFLALPQMIITACIAGLLFIFIDRKHLHANIKPRTQQ